VVCARRGWHRCDVPTFLLCHHHSADECGYAFAAWRGFNSPLRHTPAISTCEQGEHSLWWVVEAADASAALELLPAYVAERTDPILVGTVEIP
jgi:hypothetical protein